MRSLLTSVRDFARTLKCGDIDGSDDAAVASTLEGVFRNFGIVRYAPLASKNALSWSKLRDDGLQCGYNAHVDLFYAVDRVGERHDFGRVGMLYGKFYPSTQHKATPSAAQRLELFTKRDIQSALVTRQFKHHMPTSALAELTSLPGAPVTPADLLLADEIFG